MTVHEDPHRPWLARLPAVRWWLLLGFIALAVRLLWVVAMGDRSPRFDEVFYLGHAEALAEGRGYVDPTGREVAYWPPGFPALLAVAYRMFGQADIVGHFVQGALGIASCFLVSMIGTRLYGAGVGRLAALGLALYPTHVFYTTLQLTEPLFAVLLLVATVLVARPSRAMAAALGGAVLGLATLVRPSGVLFPFSLLVARPGTLWGSRAGRACAVIVVAASLVVVTPWVLRTHRVTGDWTVSTTGGHNFWMGNHPGAFGGYRYPPAINSQLLVNGEMDYGRGFGLGVAAIAEAPLQAAVRAVQKVSYLVALETDGVLWNMKGLDRQPATAVQLGLLGLANLAYLATIALAAFGLLRLASGDPLRDWFLRAVAYQVAMSVVFVGDPRYHFGLIPLAIIFAAKGAVDLRDRIAEGRLSPALAAVSARWAAIMAVFATLIALNLWLKVAERAAMGPPA